MLPDLNTIIQGAVDTVSAITGIGVVDTRQNGKSTWARTPGEKQTYLIVDHERSEAAAKGVGGTHPGRGKAQRTRRIVIDVWMPWSYGIQSAEAFRDKLEAVEWELTTHRGLGVCAKMVGLPEVEFNRIEPYTSVNQADVPTYCHHGRVAFGVIAFHPVSVS